MGYAMARAAAAQGARVVLISGPVNLPEPPGIDVHHVKTPAEMYDATHAHIDQADIFIAAAAVADYRPKSVPTQKIKKDKESASIEMVRCPDILASVAARDAAPFTVGFAAETENVEQYARAKLEKKKLDRIVANQVGHDQGFDRDDNTLTALWQDGSQPFATASKTELARDLVELVAQRFYAARGADTEPRLTVININD